MKTGLWSENGGNILILLTAVGLLVTSRSRLLPRSCVAPTIVHFNFNFNFNSVQLALVLEDYEPPALRVQGFVSRKKGARSMVEEK